MLNPLKFAMIAFLFCLMLNHAEAAVLNAEQLSATIGFGGKFKLGRWSPIFFDGIESAKAQKFRVVVPDGNGRRIAYSGPVLGTEIDRPQGWIKVGRSFGLVEFELFDGSEQLVDSGNLQLGNQAAESLDPTLPLVLTIESGEVLKNAVKPLESQLFDAASTVVSINESDGLPVCSLAYEGVQVIYLATSDVKLIESISSEQLDAIENWVRDGGKLVFCAGRTSKQVFSSPTGLIRFLPGEFDSTVEVPSSQQIERYTVSKQPLLGRGDEPLQVTRLTNITGIQEPAGTKLPTVVRQPFGFGQVVFTTLDLDLKPISEWSGLKNLLLKGTIQNLNLNRSGYSENESRNVVRVGYRDLIGQLMLPLERFRKVSFVNFTIVALLIGLFILCAGPGDFFLLKKLFRSMEWTWLTFTLLTLTFCGLAFVIAKMTKPSELQINQLEIIDVETATQVVRGSVWTNVFSPNVTTLDVDSDSSNAIGINTAGSSCWLGVPGKGLSGMQSLTANGDSATPYNCNLEAVKNKDQVNYQAELSGLPVQVASTKTIFTRYNSSADFKSRSRLKVNPVRNRLAGSFTNPLDVEIQNCRLLFENWVYIFPRPIAPGETVDIVTGTRERTTTFYFSRHQENGSDKEGGLAWNPEDTNINRISEMLMFHESARGREYTSMSNGYQSDLDLSEQVYLNRAILFGRLGDVCTQLNFKSDSGLPEFDQSRTIIRLIIPVTPASK